MRWFTNNGTSGFGTGFGGTQGAFYNGTGASSGFGSFGSSSSFGAFYGGSGGSFGSGSYWWGGAPSSGGSTTTPSGPQVGPQGVDITGQVAEDDATGFEFVASNFEVESGDPVVAVKIDSLPANGTLELNGVAVAVGQIIDSDDFGDLNYIPDADFDGVEAFTICMSTDGSTFDSTPSSVDINVLGSDDPPYVDDPIPTVPLEEGETANNIGSLIVGSFMDPDAGDTLDEVHISAIPATALGTLSYTSDAGGVVVIGAASADLSASEAASLKFAAATGTQAESASTSATITFTVKDNDGLSSTAATTGKTGTITLQISDGNDAPFFKAPNTTAATYTVDENTSSFGAPTNYNPADDVETPDTLQYSITGTDASLFNVDKDTGEIAFKVAPDYENPEDSNKDKFYSLNLVVTDESGATAKQVVTVEVKDVDGGPNDIAPTGSVSIDEGTDSAFTLTASTSDTSNNLTFAFDGGDDDDLFTIDPTTGEVEFKATPDFENPHDADTDNDYEVKVLVTGEDGETETKSITITVDNIHDEGPRFVSAATSGAAVSGDTTEGAISVTLAETVAASASFFTLVMDNGEDAPLAGSGASAVTYAVASDAGTDNFEISAAGAIKLKAGASLDFEDTSTIQLTVTTTDKDDGSTAETTVEVNVTDVDEDPELTTPTDIFSVDSDECLEIGDDILAAFTDPEGVALTFDIDAPDDDGATTDTVAGILVYDLGGVDGAAVTIAAGSSATGLTVNEVASLRYYGPESPEVNGGSATDNISSAFKATFDITADDGTAAPTTLSAFEIVVVDNVLP